MIPKLVKFCKDNNRELYLTAIVVLVAVISFGLGRLSKIREEKTPITITDTEISLSTSNINNAKTSNKNVTEKMLEQNFGNISQSQKIFVASRNGKKYYYIWCESANVIKEQNKIWFATKEEAEKAGFEPAANCRGLK